MQVKTPAFVIVSLHSQQVFVLVLLTTFIRRPGQLSRSETAQFVQTIRSLILTTGHSASARLRWKEMGTHASARLDITTNTRKAVVVSVLAYSVIRRQYSQTHLATRLNVRTAQKTCTRIWPGRNATVQEPSLMTIMATASATAAIITNLELMASQETVLSVTTPRYFRRRV